MIFSNRSNIFRNLEVIENLRLRKTKLAEESVSIFEDLLEWPVESGSATRIIDTDCMVGAGSLKITMPSGGAVVVTKDLSASPLDLNKKSLVLAVKISSLTDFTSVALNVYSGANHQTFAVRSFVAAYDPSTWQYISMHPGELAGTAIDLSNITAISFSLVNSVGTTPSIWLDDMRFVENIYPGRLSLSHDDGNLTDYTKMFPKFAALGIKASCFILTQFVGDSGKATAAQYQIMDRMGCDIGLHGRTHTDVTTLDDQGVMREMLYGRHDLESLGLYRGSRFYSYPYDRYTINDLNIGSKIFCAQFGGGQNGLSGPNAYPRLIYRIGSDTMVSADEVDAPIAAVRAHGGLYSLVCHEIGGSGIDEALYDAILAKFAASGLEISTPSELFAGQEVLSVFPPPLPSMADALRITGAPVTIPTNAGWTTGHSGGSGLQAPTRLYVNTSTTPSSTGLLTCIAFISPAVRMDWTKKTALSFLIGRSASDSQVVGRFQLKNVATEGDLASTGIGIMVKNSALFAESFASSRQEHNLSVDIGTSDEAASIVIIIVPGPTNRRAEWWVNGILKYTETDVTKVPHATSSANFVSSIINGVAGGVNASMRISNIQVWQER